MSEILAIVATLCAIKGADSFANNIESIQRSCHKYYATCMMKPNSNFNLSPTDLAFKLANCMKEKP